MGPSSYRAHLPDLPACVPVEETKGEVCELIRESIEFNIEALEEDGKAVPAPGGVRAD